MMPTLCITGNSNRTELYFTKRNSGDDRSVKNLNAPALKMLKLPGMYVSEIASPFQLEKKSVKNT